MGLSLLVFYFSGTLYKSDVDGFNHEQYNTAIIEGWSLQTFLLVVYGGFSLVFLHSDLQLLFLDGYVTWNDMQ